MDHLGQRNGLPLPGLSRSASPQQNLANSTPGSEIVDREQSANTRESQTP